MKPNPHSDKSMIKGHIQSFFDSSKKGWHFYGTGLLNYILSRIHRQIYMDTALRYMRELREEGKINYSVAVKSESKYVVL